MVGVRGFEPPTSCSQSRRAKPSYATPRKLHSRPVQSSILPHMGIFSINHLVLKTIDSWANNMGPFLKRSLNIFFIFQLRIIYSRIHHRILSFPDFLPRILDIYSTLLRHRSYCRIFPALQVCRIADKESPSFQYRR